MDDGVMTDQPGDLFNEAGKLLDAVLKRVGGGEGSRDARPRGEDDAWGRATAEEPRIATGAPECCHCPVCRAIAMSRESGPDVGRHVREAGRSLLAAALDVASAFDRTRPEENRNRSPRSRDESAGPAAGTPDRSGPSPREESRREETRRAEPSREDRASSAARGRSEPGDPWAAATGGDPGDIG
jgi:hypothetical protein